MRIVVMGYIVRGPLGGLVWHHLQYVLGLDRLGHEVYFIEDSDDYPSCYNPANDSMGIDPSYGLGFIDSSFQRFGLEERWAYHDAHSSTWYGMSESRVKSVLATTDIVLNVSGVNPIRDWFHSIPVRVLIDTDPVFSQVRHLGDSDEMEKALAHNTFFSFGENILSENSNIPIDGLAWLPSRQPIVLDVWKSSNENSNPRSFSTVMQWNSYPGVEYNGSYYGQKSDSFDIVLNLPFKVEQKLVLALGSPDAPKEKLKNLGWCLVDPLEITKTPESYQNFIRRSKAEFSIAKHGYVVSNSGWFSERSAAYLASGKPVIVQNTGFTNWMETGKGVLPFVSQDQAEEAISSVEDNYASHIKAAIEIANEYFDSNKVLQGLLDRCLA